MTKPAKEDSKDLKEAIVLAGGLGTRLRGVIADIPKPMAPVRGKPFLEYVLYLAEKGGIQRVVLAVGYKHEVIQAHFGNHFQSESQSSGMELVYAVEAEPLGTGGAIFQASQLIKGENFLVINGDSLFDLDIRRFFAQHQQSAAVLSLALKPMQDFDRYGCVEINSTNRISAFLEKEARKTGLINAGIYLINKRLWSLTLDSEVQSNLQRKAVGPAPVKTSKFSFEKDIMEKYHGSLPFYGFSHDNYFIDIGIPEDYGRAQEDFAQFPKLSHSPKTTLPQIDKTWSLFLDRDGVLNQWIKGGYVLCKEELSVLPGVPEAIASLSVVFGPIVVVTNQRGLALGLMTENDLEVVHAGLMSQIEAAGGRIDKIYHCAEDNPSKTDTHSSESCRKPNIGMPLQAQKDFPQIQFSKSIIIGDSAKDIEMGRRLGMVTVHINRGGANTEVPEADFRFGSLAEFAEALLD